ncbi:hypothetical protein HPB52_016127 [Rhipicephalus sanguineus]|uniref:Uncharacterized protein n=1 Tax=Rhipicephalus sanguineus TaxID=34632 RepID=A0A9D4PH98_RHISA|nr:hypothetical protein HPB52_016127 [Rhipicephalus sanguineus]
MWKLQGTENTHPLRVEVSVNGISLLMELDTGASVSAVLEDTFHRKFQFAQPELSNVLLKSYSGKLTLSKEAWPCPCSLAATSATTCYTSSLTAAHPSWGGAG